VPEIKNPKIVLIGAGSAHFSMSFIRDLCLSSSLANATLCLVDIDETRLGIIANLAERYAHEMGVFLRIESTTDRLQALLGADFVVNTALACNYDRMMQGFAIAKKHGFDYPGSYHILYDEAFFVNYHQLTLFDEIAEDVLRLCPDAYFLLVANPVLAGVTHLGRKFPELKTVGICHGYSALYQILEKMGIARDRITSFKMSGVNHFLWLQDLWIDGQPFFDQLKAWLVERRDSLSADQYIWRTISAAKIDFFLKHGVLAIGDTMHWTGAEWPWWCRSNAEMRAAYNEKYPEDGWQHLSQWTAGQTDQFAAWSKDESIKISQVFPPNRSDELMIPLIETLSAGPPRVFVLNMLNTAGCVPGIPLDFQIEAPVYASMNGLQPLPLPSLPRQILAHIYRDRIAPVEMELSAYNEGRRDFLVELVLMDKYAVSLRQANALVDEILDLPWNTSMKNHYQ